MAEDPTPHVSRRAFLGTTGAVVAGATAVPATTGAVLAGAEPHAPPRTRIVLNVNGVERRLEVEDRWTLVEVLRDRLDLTGTKIGCDRGECGACTVLLDDTPVYACSQLAVWADGKRVRTVEGLARNGVLHPVQDAFIAHNAAQCGFCTSGQVMNAVALLERRASPDEAEVRRAMVGNLCRCANYNALVEAVLAASRTPRAGTSGGGAR